MPRCSERRAPAAADGQLAGRRDPRSLREPHPGRGGWGPRRAAAASGGRCAFTESPVRSPRHDIHRPAGAAGEGRRSSAPCKRPRRRWVRGPAAQWRCAAMKGERRRKAGRMGRRSSPWQPTGGPGSMLKAAGWERGEKYQQILKYKVCVFLPGPPPPANEKQNTHTHQKKKTKTKNRTWEEKQLFK